MGRLMEDWPFDREEINPLGRVIYELVNVELMNAIQNGFYNVLPGHCITMPYLKDLQRVEIQSSQIPNITGNIR